MNAAATGWLLRAWVIALALTMGWFPAVANSAPGDGGLPAESPTLSLESLGVDSTFAFYGVQGTQNLTVPVPHGLAPTALNVVVEMPPNLRSGVIAVTQDNRVVSRIDLPPEDQAPISIPLVGAEIVDNVATVVLRTYLVPVEGYCLYDPTIPLRLTNASVTYEGTEAPPATVAEFLPPVLQRLTIFLPEQPSRAKSDAAVRLTATTVAHFGRQPTNVTVLPLPGSETVPPAPSQPLERQVVIRERPDSALTLQGTVGVPSLLITGPANDLTNQTRLLSSDISRLALASKAVVGLLRSPTASP
jgi:hypothetical protein